MLKLKYILMIRDFVIIKWIIYVQRRKIFGLPIVFNRPTAVVIISFILIGLFSGESNSLWQVNPKIVLTIISIYTIMRVFGYYMSNDKSRAKEIFEIYRLLKIFHPNANNQQIIRETVNAYFKGEILGKETVKAVVDAILGKETGDEEETDIKTVAYNILVYENPYDYFWIPSFKKFMKHSSKQEKAIDDAYNVIIGNAQKPKERQKLSKPTIYWAESFGVNPDELSNEQFAFFSELDKVEESNWVERILFGIFLVFIILTIINLINLEYIEAMNNAILSFVIGYVWYKNVLKREDFTIYKAILIQFTKIQAENNK